MPFASSLSRRVPVAAICAAAALFGAPAAAQADPPGSGACAVPTATQQFAGVWYYDAGGFSASPENPQVVSACVNVAHPRVRVSVGSADPGASLSLVAVFHTGEATVAVPVGTLPATPGLSEPLTVEVVNRSSLRESGTASFTLVVSARGGSVQVSDTWIDPWGG